MRGFSEVQRFYILVVFLPVAACASLFLFRPFLDKPGRTLCIFKQVTGLPCPACNTGHGVYELLEGKWQDAVYQNPVSVFAVFFGGIAGVWLIADMVRRKPGLYYAFKRSDIYLKQNKWLLVLVFMLIAADWSWQLFKYFHGHV
jgi:acyl-coenzyme A synthetase/AMP-(fatty) acid ligase